MGEEAKGPPALSLLPHKYFIKSGELRKVLRTQSVGLGCAESMRSRNYSPSPAFFFTGSNFFLMRKKASSSSASGGESFNYLESHLLI